MNTEKAKAKELPTEQNKDEVSNQAEGGPLNVTGSTNKKKRRSKPPSIESIGMLLSLLYRGKFKRSTLKKAELDAMRANPMPDGAEREQLINLARSDLILDKTRQLLLLSLRISGPVSIRIRDFAREVLQQHPLFQSELLAGVLKNLPDSASEDRAISALLAQKCDGVPWPPQSETMTKEQYSKCQANALYCLIIIFRTTRGISLGRILGYLNTYLWAPIAQRYEDMEEKLAAIVSTPDPAAAAITFGLLQSQITEQQRRAYTAQRSVEHAAAHIKALEQKIADLQTRLEDAEAAAERVKAELAAAKESHTIAEAHWKDDYEQLRGRIRRRLKEDLILLDEGLHALHRDPPKVHVMIDHAERVMDAIKSDLERL